MPRTHHLHTVAQGSQEVKDHLDFRDALRADPGLRQQYQQLKHSLSVEHKHDRAQYGERKGAFVQEALAQWRTQ